MIEKIIPGDSQEELIRTVGRMVQVWETGAHIKSAASPIFSKEDVAKWAPPKGKFLTHSVTLGNMELFGNNRNNDDWPDEELKKSHHTFVTHAKVFREHNNKRPEFAIGEIKEARYSPKLGWGEALFWTDIDKAASEFEKARKNEEQHTSMAAAIDHDVCECCGHISKYAHDRCDHIRFTPGRYLKEYQKYAHMINRGIRFKDQSWVKRPADRIAHTLEYGFHKAASEAISLRGDQLADFIYGSPLLEPLQQIHAMDVSDDPLKLAAVKWVWQRAFADEFDSTLVAKMANHPYPARVLRSLEKRAMLMPVTTFHAWLRNQSPTTSALDPVVMETREKMASIRAIIIQRVSTNPGFSSLFGDTFNELGPSGCCCEDEIDSLMDKARDQFSCRYEALVKRSLYCPSGSIKAAAEPSEEAIALGAVYNAYLLRQKEALAKDPEVRYVDEILASVR